MTDEYRDDAPVIEEQQEEAPEQVTEERLPEDYSQFVSPQEEEAVQPPQEEHRPQSDWEHKYKVLKGKYDKEVPRLTKEIKQLKFEKEQLMQRLSLLEQILAHMKEQPASKPIEEEDEELAKIKEDYPEVYKAMTKLIEKKIRSEVKPEIESVKSSSTQASFYSRLSALVPDWQTLNTDPEFIEWLSERSSEFPSKTRHQLMLMAYNEGDVEGVAHFFNSYKREKEMGSEPKQQQASAERVVNPPHKRSSQSGKEPVKKIFTESEVRKFYTDAALGKIPPEKKAKLEEEIVNAILENRILYGR